MLDEDPAWNGESGRVHQAIEKSLARFLCGPEQTTAYLCGHPGMIETGKEILQRAGLATESIREERYRTL